MNSTTRLTRSSDDRYIGGVSGGLGRYFDIDPTIVRVGFIFATLVTGGAAIVGYVAMLAFVPSDNDASRDPLPA